MLNGAKFLYAGAKTKTETEKTHVTWHVLLHFWTYGFWTLRLLDVWSNYRLGLLDFGTFVLLEKVSHVTVSGVWGDQRKGVACNGFWGLWGQGKRCHM